MRKVLLLCSVGLMSDLAYANNVTQLRFELEDVTYDREAGNSTLSNRMCFIRVIKLDNNTVTQRALKDVECKDYIKVAKTMIGDESDNGTEKWTMRELFYNGVKVEKG